MSDVNAPAPASTEPAEAHVAELSGRLLKLVHRALAGHDWGGLRTAHFRVLGVIPPSGATITELSERLSMTKQAVGQFVTHLQATGHLDVRTDPLDRRRRVVVRTGRGDDTVERVDAVITGLERRWEQQVGSGPYRQFREVLMQINLDM